MLFKRNKKDDDLRLRGWKKLLYKLGRVLLFPLRRPLLTLFIALILFLAPTFRGVKPINVHKWYAAQIYKAYNGLLVWWGSRQPEVAPGAFKFNPSDVAPAPVTPSEFQVPAPVEEKVPNILDTLRGSSKPEDEAAAKKEEPAPQEEKQPEPEDVTERTIQRKGIRIPKDDSLYAYPENKKVYVLKYVDFPHEIVGRAKVHNCNEIEINGEFILMYGIYVHPYTAQGERAMQYLKDLVEGKEVKCGIVAYTEQDIATGICYVGEENINRNMVIKGYTKNVAL